MIDDTGRRRFLELAGTGTALSVAGCNAFQSDDADGDGGLDTDGGQEATVTLAVEPDQEELESRQSEIQSDVQSQNMSGLEAQQEYRRRAQEVRTELTKEAVGEFEGRVDEEAQLTIDDSIEQFGILQVTGSATALISALSFEEVGALLPESVFANAQAQANAQQGNGTDAPN